MKEIKLSKNNTALVDDDDYELLSSYKWHICGAGNYIYAKRKIRNENGVQVDILMHRDIMGAGKGQFVDHINRNTLDNRKSNLRFCTPTENQINSKLSKSNTSGYKGVIVNKRGKFVARICVNRSQIYIGTYGSAKEAADAYKNKAIDLFGWFAT